MKFSKKNPFLVAFIASPLALITAPSIQAAGGAWNVDAAGNWSATANWTPAAVPGTTAGDAVNLQFNITAARIVTIDTTSRSVGDLNIGDPTAALFGYTLAASGGAALNLDGSAATAATVDFTAAIANTISAPITLVDDGIFRSNVNAAMTLSGIISGTGKSVTFNNDTNGTVNAATALLGQFALSGANTYSGGTSISDVRVLVSTSDFALGTGNVTIESGGQVLCNTARTLANTFSIAGDGWVETAANQPFGALRLDSGATVSGAVTMTGNAAIGSAAGTGTVSGIISGGFNLSKRGVGRVNLSGNNAYTGTTSVTLGILGATKPAALPGIGTLNQITVASGGTLAAFVGGAGEFTSAEVDSMRSNVGFNTGSLLGLDPSNAPGGSFTYASNLSDASAVAGTLGINKLGGSVLVLSGTNTYSGITTVSAGALSIPNPAALPGYTTNGSYSVANGATLAVGNAISGAEITSMLGTTNFLAGSSLGFDTSSGDRIYGANLANTAQGALGLGKVGANTLTLNGANTYTGTTTVFEGTLVAAGSSAAAGNIVVGNTTANAVLNVPTGGTMTGGTITAGTVNGAAGAVNVTGGTLAMGTGETTDTISFGAAEGAYGAFTISGGTFTQQRFMFGGTGSTTTLGGTGVGLITGGTVNSSGSLILARTGASTGILTVNGGLLNHAGASNDLAVGLSGSGRAELNVGGGLLDNTGRRVTFSGGTGGTFHWSGTGLVNLNGGTLLTNSIIYDTTTSPFSPNANSYVNFGGGTLKATAASAVFFPAHTPTGTGLSQVYINGPFGSFTGGATIDTNGFDNTVSANFLAPSGNGVTGLTIDSAGSGYIGAPAVKILDGGLPSTATAYAVVGTDPAVPATFGKVTSVVITNPGVITGAATVSLVGGGGTGAAVSVSSTGPNTSGGFTKTGSGRLTLTGNSTYTGRTTVNEGTLSVSGVGNLAASSGLSVSSGATFAYYPTVPATPLTFATGSTLILADNSTIATTFDSTIVVSGAASASGTVNLALSGAFTSGNPYNVLSAASGLGAVNYRILNPSNFTYTASRTATGVTITPTAAAALASAYWLGGFAGNPGLWSVSDGSSASNWTADGTGTVSPLVPGATTNVIFSDATALSGNQTGMKLGADMAIGSLTFNSTNPVSLLNNDASVLSIGSGITVNPSAGPVTLSANIAATSAQTWTNNSLNSFSVGAVNTAGFALTLGGSGSSSLAGVVSGTGTLTKTGPGTATLTAANTYSGATTIAEGTLTLSGARAGASGAITLGTTGLNPTLNITTGTYNLGGNQFNVGNSNPTAATSTVNQTGGAISFTSANALLIGQNTVGNQGVYNLSGGSITTYTSASRGIMLGVNSNPAPGLNSGGGTFNLSGTGTINMTAASGAPGDGILQIGRSDAVANNTTNAFNQTGGTANVGILALGGGATSGSTGVTSTLNLTGGTFTANQFTLLSAGATNTCTINIGGTAVVTLPAFPTVRGAGSSATLNFDGGTLRPTAATTTYMGGLTNAFIKAGGAKLETSFAITVAQNLLADPGSPGGGLTKTGPANSTLTLTGNNTYTGGTTINSGRISVSAAAPLSSGTITITGDSTVGGQLFVTGTPTITNNYVISGVGYPDTITTANTGRGGAIRASTGQTFSGSITLAGDSRIGFIAGTSSVTLSGQITGSKAIDFYGGLNGNSALHTFTLANTGTANDHTGNTSITAVDFGAARTGGQAILQLGAGNQIPNGPGKGNLVFNGADANHIAILELNGFNETINGVSNVAAAGAIIRNTATGAPVLTIGDADTSSTFSGVITDGGTGKTLGLAKTGTGTLTLTGANSYIGNTAVSAGTLALADDAQLKFVLGATTGVNNSLTGAGTAVLDGDFVIDTTAADALDTGTWTLENVSSLAGAYGATFSVLGFTDAGSSNWEKPISPTKKYVFNETTGTLTLTPVVGGYAPWINGFFPGVTNPLIIGPAADPDFDGIPNGIEIVIGGNPANGIDPALLPTLELVTDPLGSPAIPAGNYLLFTYRRSDLSVAGGVTASCETDLDLLGSWTTAVGGASGVVIQVDDNFTFTPPAGADTDRVRVYVPRGANPLFFGRLKALVP